MKDRFSLLNENGNTASVHIKQYLHMRQNCSVREHSFNIASRELLKNLQNKCRQKYSQQYGRSHWALWSLCIAAPIENASPRCHYNLEEHLPSSTAAPKWWAYSSPCSPAPFLQKALGSQERTLLAFDDFVIRKDILYLSPSNQWGLVLVCNELADGHHCS